MRSLSIFLAATALLTALSAAQADPGSTQLGNVTAQQMEKVTGNYKLSNGQRAEIFPLGTRLYMKIGLSQQKELVVAGPNRLASRDGAVSIQFDSDFDSERIVLEHGRNIGLQATIRLAANDRPGRGATN